MVSRKLQTLFDIISIGYELLDGRVLNTNAKWLGEQISGMGGRVCRIIAVGDDVDEISAVIRDSIRRGVDWVITTGGLGPTYDDVTLQGVAKAVKRRLVLNKKAVEFIRKRYEELAARGVVDSPELTPSRLKMAMLPRGAKPLENDVGTAPGVLLRAGRTRIVCLPGVPSELEDIFLKRVKPILEKSIKKVAVSDRWIYLKGVPESTLAPKIDEIRARYPEVFIKSHPERREGVSLIRMYLKALAKRRESCEKILDRVERDLVKIIEDLGGAVIEPEEVRT
ncbi:MAG: hypothetical protein DRJ31_08615 [Candidatus Methanomethylicota archaeon]|uniref:MoaB/Mog domain-containing protein n=1 Tax=Thermoproteota archaeon TaxID=2056631 RepID=A0A497ELE1_9CREN|nr:MAG: hypothetical protein DRJ31_08615 [Candidatus Verstraetearchaeota archaeon]